MIFLFLLYLCIYIVYVYRVDISTLFIGYYNTTIIYTTIILGVGNRRSVSVLCTCIRLPTPRFILVNIIISKI